MRHYTIIQNALNPLLIPIVKELNFKDFTNITSCGTFLLNFYFNLNEIISLEYEFLFYFLY